MSENKGNRGARIREIFFLLIELPKEKRKSKLDELCQNDSSLLEYRSEIEQLLNYEVTEPQNDISADVQIGHKIGDYKILELLGMVEWVRFIMPWTLP